jgi:hypothetical protein
MNTTRRVHTALVPFVLGTAWVPQDAQAARYGLFVGPPALGIGDSNPVTFSNPFEYELQFATDKGFEARAALVGLYAGWRLRSKGEGMGGYVSFGGGLALDANGLGVGPYASAGFDFFCAKVCGSIEVFQAFALGASGIIAPSAIRLGVSLWL